jgi:hypothetical protein
MTAPDSHGGHRLAIDALDPAIVHLSARVDVATITTQSNQRHRRLHWFRRAEQFPRSLFRRIAT